MRRVSFAHKHAQHYRLDQLMQLMRTMRLFPQHQQVNHPDSSSSYDDQLHESQMESQRSSEFQ